MKTGYINASGFNVVTSVQRDGRRLVGVMFGGDSALDRDRQIQALFDEAFEIASARRPARYGTTYVATRTERRSKTKAVAAVSPRPAANPAATQARSAPPPPVAAKNTGRWAIQVGAFNAADLAHAQIGKVSQLAANIVDGAEPAVDSVKNRGKTIYRARLTGFSESKAVAACRSLERRRIDCLPVNLENARG
jgi:D-alanyl-D-alanine carboxypeptidase